MRIFVDEKNLVGRVTLEIVSYKSSEAMISDMFDFLEKKGKTYENSMEYIKFAYSNAYVIDEEDKDEKSLNEVDEDKILIHFPLKKI